MIPGIFEWARPDNLQPEPITLAIWQELPEDFCQEVEVVEGAPIRVVARTRPHQKAARRLADMLETAAEAHMRQYGDGCLDVDTDFDVVLWELPRTTIRRPDAALFECAPPEVRPLPGALLKLVVEVVSPGTEKTDIAEKKAEYALAGIPWYWIVWVADNRVRTIEIHVLDHALGQYRPHRVLDAVTEVTVIDTPVRVSIDWARLSELSR